MPPDSLRRYLRSHSTVHCPTDKATDTFPSFFQSGLLVYGFRRHSRFRRETDQNTFLLPLFACALAAIPAASAQVKFRVIFDGNSSFYEPVSIAQLSPHVFIWNLQGLLRLVSHAEGRGGLARLSAQRVLHGRAVPGSRLAGLQ